jgi:hypothetical protein
MRAGLSFLLTLDGRVSRRAYALTGFGLMAFKYAVEAVAMRRFAGQSWTPLDYFSPLYSIKASKLAYAPDWLLLALGIWTLPFVWIGAAFTLRRARDAGFGPGAVLAFFVPLGNYAAMLLLAAWPTREPTGAESLPTDAGDDGWSSGPEPAPRVYESALLAVAVTAALGLALVLFSTWVSRSYGTTLFLGVPFVLGFEAAFLLNHRGVQSRGTTLSVVAIALLLLGLFLMLFAAEGFLCIAMAAPLAAPLAFAGGVFGRELALARMRKRVSLVPALLIVPLAGLEARLSDPCTFEVVSALEIDAPPARVWPNVIGFSELPEPEHWIFSTGIAYPLRAVIEGEGVGAVRRCEFSTGAFVEPITHWEPPARLAFDVVSQPLPMEEWSFYRKVHPPHLDESFRALRGEFRLIELPGGRTRLEGSTWYHLDAFPLGYWRALADTVVHRIHLRVLEHIADLSAP